MAVNQNKKLVILNNEKISKSGNRFYCDNIDIKSIPEDLNKNFNVTLIARNSKIKRARQIDLANIEIINISILIKKINNKEKNKRRQDPFMNLFFITSTHNQVYILVVFSRFENITVGIRQA